jgi:hypothetical protein
VHTLTNEIRILEDYKLIEVHSRAGRSWPAPHCRWPSHWTAARQQREGTVDQVRRHVIGPKMPQALEVLDDLMPSSNAAGSARSIRVSPS